METGHTADLPLLEAWTAPTELQTKLTHLRDFFAPLTKETDVLNGSIDMHTKLYRCGNNLNQINALAAISAKPHVDELFPEWTVLFILQGAMQTLWVADHKPKNLINDTSRRPRFAPRTSVILTEGQIVLFNAHRTHWMDGIGKKIMIALTFDFKRRPTKQQVNAFLAGKAAEI